MIRRQKLSTIYYLFTIKFGGLNDIKQCHGYLLVEFVIFYVCQDFGANDTCSFT